MTSVHKAPSRLHNASMRCAMSICSKNTATGQVPSDSASRKMGTRDHELSTSRNRQSSPAAQLAIARGIAILSTVSLYKACTWKLPVCRMKANDARYTIVCIVQLRVSTAPTTPLYTYARCPLCCFRGLAWPDLLSGTACRCI
jgi:hypothetical protein